MMKEKIQFYESFSDDVVENSGQDFSLPEAYVWIKNGVAPRLCSGLLYGIARAAGFFYCRFGLHASVKNRRVFRTWKKQGYFLYANHTQPLGDVFLPAFANPAKRVYTIVSPANLGLPVIGRLLPCLGALPVPSGFCQMKRFLQAIAERVRAGNSVVVYPEAHVWPYYTKIRPFPATSFRFPVENRTPAFAMTTTYEKRRWGKKPKLTVYLDGPFWPDETLSKKEQQKKLRDEIFACMERRSRCSTCEYIRYQKKEVRM